jgi:DNA-binding NtrC family response regulator
MTEVMRRAHAFAPAATPVTLHGESGCGKTFLARYIHDLSQRPAGFHAFSVGTVAPQLAADELFGHVKGAYTDAHGVRPGRIATAGGGTLLLDDLQTADLGLQKQMLQMLDSKTYSPVGSDRVVVVACRIIFAMTEDPDTLMRTGVLLKDLRYRLGRCTIRIPSLRERRDEIPLLAQRALERCPEETQVEGPTEFADPALALLREAEFEGNVRELRAVVEYGYLMTKAAGAEKIGVEHLPSGLFTTIRYQRRGSREANRLAVERALCFTGGNVRAAARLLDVSRNTVTALRAKPRNVRNPLRSAD